MGESGILRDIGLFDSSKARIQQPHRPGTTAASSQPSSHTAPPNRLVAPTRQPYRPSQTASSPQPGSRTAPVKPPRRPNPATILPQPNRRTTKQQRPKRLDSRTSKDDNPNSRTTASRTIARTYSRNRIQWHPHTAARTYSHTRIQRHPHTATTAYSHNRQQPQTTAQPVQ